MLEELKEEVYLANLELPKQDLVKYTWGNVSGFDEETQYFVIKPSGVDYENLKPKDMIVVDLDGNIVEGEMNPSSDTKTHAVLYKKFPDIRAVVHTHSPWATMWAQAGLDVPALGTTHADTFYGRVPCARFLTKAEIEQDYEKETGNLIYETFTERDIDYKAVPGVLLRGHGPFTWGESAEDAVVNSVVLEEVCKMNYLSKQLNPNVVDLPQEVLDKHYLRKHGESAYYGQ